MKLTIMAMALLLRLIFSAEGAFAQASNSSAGNVKPDGTEIMSVLQDKDVKSEMTKLPDGATVKWTSKNAVKILQIQEMARQLSAPASGPTDFDAALRQGNWKEVNKMLESRVRHGLFGNTNLSFKSPTPESLNKGKKLFIDHCSICHGLDAKGTGIAAKELSAMPANLIEVTKHLPNRRFVMQIRFGAGDMPAWQDVLDEDDMLSITHYVRSLMP